MTAPFVLVFFLLLVVAVPVAHAMLGGVAAALWLDGKPMAVIAQRLYTPTQSFPMLAIPFFILAGNLMMSGKFGVYLVNIARLIVGHLKGGLGHVSIMGSVMFGGVSGSAVADASALGNALIPVQIKQGYPRAFASAINASSSTISVLIPPSIPLILYGLISNVSIVNLFIAGILPGLLLGAGLLIAVAIVRLMPSFTKISSNFASLKWGERALAVVYDDIRDLEAKEREFRRKQAEGLSKPLPFEHELRLENISYSYPGSAESALIDVSLSIPKNASVGFVGPSGAGKTTIVDVILGLLEPMSGRILVDGVDIQDRVANWQRKIGYIPQTIYLTDDTIRKNVAFGLDDGEIDDDLVWEAIDAAQLRELVNSLPDGLDTIVGERGVRLSGGQRQRVGIARALYHKPQVLVMDEATSALDNQTERHIVDALDNIRGSRTMIMIAHRLSTVQNCDTLYYLDEGRLKAQGTYEELLATTPEFAAMAVPGVDVRQPEGV